MSYSHKPALSILTLIAIFILRWSNSYCQQTAIYYLAKNSADNGDGSFQQPFNSFDKVQEVIDNSAGTRSNIKVFIRQGVYELHRPLLFTKADSDSLGSIQYSAYGGEKVTISGGKTLSGTWTKTEKTGIWRLKINSFNKATDVFRALFANGKRLQRATSDTLYSASNSLYQSQHKAWDFPSLSRLAADSIEVFCGFEYTNNSLDSLKDLSGEIIVYNSWEASWHTIRNIDKGKHRINFQNPATYPVGFFGPKVRFRVENAKDYLDTPGEWLLDYDNGELLYYAGHNENPNSMNFVASRLNTLLNIRGDGQNGKFVNNIKFSDIEFSYSEPKWGFNKISGNPANNYTKFPWLNLKSGFASNQGALDCGAAILLESARNCSFENCTFSHLGNYAIWIGEYSTKNVVIDSKIYDNGGGGVIIGIDAIGGIRKNWPATKSPSKNSVINCSISDCGKFFPSGLGIGIMQASDNIIRRNKIKNLPYSGISVGWSFNFENTYTRHNLIEYNYIENVLTTLADGGAIYTLGNQMGSIYQYNYIKNIGKSKSTIGGNNGFFFDQGSSNFKVFKNVVENVQNEDYRFNKTDRSKVSLTENHFQKNESNEGIKKSIEKALKIK